MRANTLQYLAVFLIPLSLPLPLAGVLHTAHRKTLLKMSTAHIKGWMEKREGGVEREEQPSMHDQTSVSHWSTSLAFSDSLLWPKRKEEDEEEERRWGGRM